MNTLKQAKIGSLVRVVNLHNEAAMRRRLMDLGITRGAQVYVRGAAPLGDPIEVSCRGSELTLRREDAALIEVEA